MMTDPAYQTEALEKELKRKVNDEFNYQGEMEGLNPSASRKSVVTKGMSLREQLDLNRSKKGKKTFLLDSDEAVDWFMKKYVSPEFQKKSYQLEQAEKEKLIQSGVLPRDPDERIEYYCKKNQMMNKKYLEDTEIARKQGKVTDQDNLVLQMEELENMDEIALKKVMREMRIKDKGGPVSAEEKKLMEEDQAEEEAEEIKEYESLLKSAEGHEQKVEINNETPNAQSEHKPQTKLQPQPTKDSSMIDFLSKARTTTTHTQNDQVLIQEPP